MKVTGFLNDDMTVSIGCEQIHFAAGHDVKIWLDNLNLPDGLMVVEFGEGYATQLSIDAINDNFTV